MIAVAEKTSLPSTRRDQLPPEELRSPSEESELEQLQLLLVDELKTF